MTIESICCFNFEAARTLSSVASTHGHSFKVIARARVEQDVLEQSLADVCQPWHMQDLNAFFSNPTDVLIAQHIVDTLQQQLGQVVQVELRSSPDVWVACTEDVILHGLTASFSAAHYLPNVPEGHQCGRLHGHGFKVKLWVDARLSDASALEKAWLDVRVQLHHAYLNHIEGLENPTSEHLTEWLWQRLGAALPMRAVEVFETSTAGSRRDASGFTIWKELRFEAACPFDDAGRYTGHSYLTRLYLHGSQLDAHAGWLRDFAEVKAIFKPIYQQLDHYALDCISDLSTYDNGSLAAWLVGQLKDALPELRAVEVFESEQRGAAAYVQRSCDVHC